MCRSRLRRAGDPIRLLRLRRIVAVEAAPHRCSNGASSRLALLLLCLLAHPAHAQPMPTTAEATTLLQQVMPSLQPALRAVLDQPFANQPTPWKDDASGLSGAIIAAAPLRDGGLCRRVRVTVRDGTRQLAVEGQRCRMPDGDWGLGHVVDTVTLAPEGSPLIRDLEVALHRLDYYPGAVDGVASEAFIRALLAFEHDEQVPPVQQPDPALLDLADAAIGRIPAAGICQAPRPIRAGASLACGSIR